MLRWLSIIAVITAIGGAYIYVGTLNTKIENLTTKNVELTLSKKEQDDTIEFLQKERLRVATQLENTFSNLSDIRQQNAILQRKIRDNNIGQIAEKKPALVENIINEATKKSNRCLELVTGSPLTKQERNAKNAQDFNSECPWLFPAK